MHGSMRFWQCSSRNAMSASGHEQTSRHVRVMSVIPLKADIHQRGLHVRLVPEADINYHLFSAVVIALIRLFQFGGPVEIRPSTPWHGSRQSAAASVI
jgi:hypothetical protein